MGRMNPQARKHRGGKPGSAGHKRRTEEPDLNAKIRHALRQARKAANKAKTFEIQKVVKKLKSAKTATDEPATTSSRSAGTRKKVSQDDAAELDRQLEALKNLSHRYIGQVALMSKVKKDKSLASHPQIIETLNSLGSVSAKNNNAPPEHPIVYNRVLSSKLLASTLQTALDDLRSKVNPPTAETATNDPSDPAAASQSDESAEEGDVDMVSGADDIILDDADENASNAGWESGSVDDTAPAQGLGDGESEDHTRTPHGHASNDLDPMEEDESDNGDTDQDEVSENEDRGTSSRGKLAAGTASSSMFLPSLAVGFARGEDSDWSDGEAKVADGVRKNRRGQRARQAIWEKKFGRGAKHVVKRQQEEAIAGAYATRGARRGGRGRGAAGRGGRGASDRGRGRGSGIGRGSGGAAGRGVPRGIPAATQLSRGQGSNSIPIVRVPAPAPKTDKPVHPSWEAKQKQKSAAAIVPSQAKKIVF
ncbi:Bud-site selection protein [Auriculariales sp. MPI-PUGE-AT-0066]|nr:Bud-site selection protein [Auriculariales sp. MPI-PUGE-AT-0066]